MGTFIRLFSGMTAGRPFGQVVRAFSRQEETRMLVVGYSAALAGVPGPSACSRRRPPKIPRITT